MGGGGVLVNLGGDIAVAGEHPLDGWAIQASEDGATPLSDAEETVSITSGGVATSGTTVRRWVRGATVLHHIIDPATGLPVDTCWRTVTVDAGTGGDGDRTDRKSTRLNSSHRTISYAVFCLKKKNKHNITQQ